MKYIIVVDKQSRNNPSNEKKEIIIEIDELLKKDDIHDDFIIENGVAKVIRRVGLTEYHETYILNEEEIEELGEKKIKLFKGDNYIYIKDEYNNNICAEYIVKSDFTDMYVTHLQMNSAIELKAGSITNTVSATYATKDSLNETKKTLTASLELKLDTQKLISEINASADVINLKAGRLLITSGNFKLDDKGNITCTGGNIGGFTLSSTEFKGELNGLYDYDVYDLRAIQNSIMGNLNINPIIQDILDVNNDGSIKTIDYMMVKGILENNIVNTKNITGTFKIDSTNPKKCISILKNGETCVSLGLGGITANLITADNIICAYGNLEQANYRGVVINGRVPNIKLVSGSTVGTTITFSSVTSQAINNTSLESIKKNITKFDNALEIIENSEIYEYNFKTEKNEDKKHIGFVIGEKYKTPDIVKSNDGQAIESYSMSSISWRGLQQVIEILKRIDKRLKVLEGK